MKVKYILATTLLSSALLSCSTLKKSDEASPGFGLKVPEAQVEVSLVDTDKRLKERVQDAQMRGKDAVEFLSSELYLKASDASLRGENEMAVMLFKHLVSLKNDDAFLKKKYAAELIRFGRLPEAERALAQVFLKNGKDESVGLVLGGIYTALNENKKAQEIYEKLLKLNKKNEEACVLLGKSFFMQKKMAEAQKTLDTCEKDVPKNGIFSYYKGKFLLEQNQNAQAIKAFETALKYDPSYYQAAMAIGMLSEEKEDWKGAAKVYKNFLDKNPDSFPIISRYVQILFVLEDFKTVLPYAEQLSSYDPSDLNLKLRLGVLYSEAKRYDEAKSIFKEILVAVPDSDKVLYYLGSLNELTADWDLAQEYFKKVTKESPLYHDSTVQIAKIFYTMALNGKTAEATEDERLEQFKNLHAFVKERVQSSPDLKLDLYLILSNYHEAKDNFAAAISLMGELKGQKGYEENHDYYLASLYEKNKEQAKAREIVQYILKKNPDNANALNFLGYSYLESGENMKQAYDYISKAVTLKPEDGYIRDSLGWYYYKTGDLKRALQEMKKAWELAKNDVVITKHLAIIHQDMRNYEEAKRFFVEALKNCRIESERADVLKSMESLEKVRLPASSAEN